MKYKVGQTVYLLVKKSKKVFPVKVIEEITRKTLEGEVISYTGMFPDKERTQVDLKEFELDVYMSHEDVRIAMIENATQVIDAIVSEAVGINASVFGVEEVIESEEAPHIETADEDRIDLPSDDVEVDLGNGITAKVNLAGISEGA